MCVTCGCGQKDKKSPLYGKGPVKGAKKSVKKKGK